MQLNWKSYGDRGRTAKGDKGTWRVVDGHDAWWLTVEPPFTRGMLNQGKFDDRQRAMDAAQERENDGEPFEPMLICAT